MVWDGPPAVVADFVVLEVTDDDTLLAEVELFVVDVAPAADAAVVTTLLGLESPFPMIFWNPLIKE